jgi:hypothetical protein
MAEPVFYIRGLPQSLSSENLPEGLFDDLKAIVDLPDDVVGDLYKNLSLAQGFLNPKDLLAIINKVIKKANMAEAIWRIIKNIGPSQVERLITIMENKVKEKDFPFDKTQLERLKQILKKLVQPYPSMERFKKAERISNITGQQMETVELICDLRPIFDETRKKVEGIMPYTRLHIVATGEDGLPNAFEVELTQQNVIELAEKAEKAKSKLVVLRQSIENWLPGGLPDLPLTRITRKESNDD